MIYELRTYTLRPGTMAEFLLRVERDGLPIARKYLKLVGYWQSETGTLNQMFHMWAHDSLDARAANRAKLMADPDWHETYLKYVLPLFERQETVILKPTPFSPLQ
ncbi:MAG: NIPSNAP family protein [Alphaproteobacteria bacterium]